MRWMWVVALSLAGTPALADGESWILLPARASEAPPPGDPTLLRLTRALGEALLEAVGGSVRVVSRDLRDQSCPSLEGVCPKNVARVLGAERVVSVVLGPRYDRLAVRVYEPGVGATKTLTLPCAWSDGRAVCDAKGFALLAPAVAAAEPAKGAPPKPKKKG